MKKRIKIILIVFLSLIVILTGAFLIYAADYYKAEPIVEELINNNDSIIVNDDYTFLKSSVESDTAIIFYPGAKVEYTAYIPILYKLSQNGINCILVKMPFNMAIFDSNAADEIFSLFPDIENWYIGGHSMGGAMASSYASDNQDKLEGLILLGAYIYQDYPEENALTIYGTFNSNLEKNIDYTENIVIIEGGNHAQFGNYGKQKGDPDATISTEQQQDIAVDAILDFIDSKSID